MNKLTCPRCENQFFTAAKPSHLPCPFCGFIMKADPDKRSNGRQHMQAGCDIVKGDVRVPVKTVDLSSEGVGIKMMGYLPFQKDEEVDVLIEDLNITRKAQIVWTKMFYGISRAGLRFGA